MNGVYADSIGNSLDFKKLPEIDSQESNRIQDPNVSNQHMAHPSTKLYNGNNDLRESQVANNNYFSTKKSQNLMDS